MEKKPSQNDTEIQNPEINNTGSNSFENVPYELIVTILPFLGLQDMGNLASVNKEFHRIITNAFTNPNMYTAYPGMFEALCKFWHENPVAFNKWFKLYRIDKIQTAPHGVNQRDQACDYIFNAFQLTDGSVRIILNNALKMVFQNNTDDITQFLLPLVFNANKFALYSRFGHTTLQETSEAQINTWTTETQPSRKNIHALLFCLLFSRDIKFFNGKHQVLNPMLDYAEKNIGEIFGQETIRKYGEGFIKALLQSCRLTLAAANETMATVVRINDIRSTFPNVPINLAGANLYGANLYGANLSGADLTDANLEYANLEYANLFGANLTYAHLEYANLFGANLTGANLTGAHSRHAQLTSAYLRGAHLTGAYLSRANLTGANLSSANLTHADLTLANLTGADLTGANLTGAYLMGADLKGAKLTDAYLTGADWTGAYLTGANLTSAKLPYAKLRDAYLTGAYLTGANLRSANLRGADLRAADLTGADLTCANLRYAILGGAYLTGADFTNSNLFRCLFSSNTKLEGIKINSTALLSVFIDGIYSCATTNIWSLNNEMIDTFKLLLPHAEIKELELLMEGIKNRILVNPLDFIFGTLEKARILKLISKEIAKKQASQKIACEEPTQKAAISGNSQQNANTIDSTLELPNQSENTISFNP